MGIQAPHQTTIRLLGPCCLLVGNNLVQGVPASFFRIAAYLILSTPEQVQARSRLAALFWPNADDGKAAANLRQAYGGQIALLEGDTFNQDEAVVPFQGQR